MKIIESAAFALQTLIPKNENTGPMGPVLFMNEVYKQMGFQPYNDLDRVHFSDPEIYQIYEDSGKRGLTGHDILIAGGDDSHGYMVTLWIDLGSNGLAVVLVYEDELSEGLIFSPIYNKEKEKFEKIPSNETLLKICEIFIDKYKKEKDANN